MRNTLRCKCGGGTDVINSRYRETTNEVRRRRECLLCGIRYTTIETIAYEGLQTRDTPKSVETAANARIKEALAKIRREGAR